MGDEALPPTVRQLRLVVEADDFDAAVAFDRDALGLDEEFFVESERFNLLANRVDHVVVDVAVHPTLAGSND